MKTFIFDFEARLSIAGVRFTIDNQSEDSIFTAKPLIGLNFLAYPLLEMNGEVVKPETTFMFRRIGA